MKVAIICVNYNSYDSLRNYLHSIDKAVYYSKGYVDVAVYVADNSTKKESIIKDTNYEHIIVRTFDYNNLGYLGGAFSVINSIEEERSSIDFFVISNVDVLMDENFFIRFLELEIEDNVAWIAPEIYVTSLNKVGNFEMESRPSSRRMKFYNILYSSILIFKLYYYMSRIWIRTSTNNKDAQDIYSGYGSFMIFSSRFINSIDKWVYPPFLFGEEIFFAEKARQFGLKVIYRPELIIYDIGKVSTGKITSQNKLKMQKESNLFLYNEFFRK